MKKFRTKKEKKSFSNFIKNYRAFRRSPPPRTRADWSIIERHIGNS